MKEIVFHIIYIKIFQTAFQEARRNIVLCQVIAIFISQIVPITLQCFFLSSYKNLNLIGKWTALFITNFTFSITNIIIIYINNIKQLFNEFQLYFTSLILIIYINNIKKLFN